MTDWTFHPRYVAPFHDRLVGAALEAMAADERAALRRDFHARAAELATPALREMLHGGWRASAMAAWFIAARGDRTFQLEVERFIADCPGHVAPMCVCLAHLGGDSASAALAGYLEARARAQHAGQPCDDALAPEWALCAWAHLAGADPRPRWAAFVAAEMAGLARAGWLDGRPGFDQALREGWTARFEAARDALPRRLAFVATDLSRSSDTR